ncbi:hypothetical protein LTS18_002831 [Coniosporium uncinatum]|uniref:Uncharacterized protein n=1 Tax=Coniosporium uncinatum TaxID=93489 RepID=A0ACC3DY36_9PEZI|nr:hypothetical protein LTS18_002831 [Coniosporium uncinatum]
MPYVDATFYLESFLLIVCTSFIDAPDQEDKKDDAVSVFKAFETTKVPCPLWGCTGFRRAQMEPTPIAPPQHSEQQSPQRPIQEPYPAPAHAEPTDAAQKPQEVKPSVEDNWGICGPWGCQSLRPVIANARHGAGESMFESQHPISEGVSAPGVEKNALWDLCGPWACFRM